MVKNSVAQVAMQVAMQTTNIIANKQGAISPFAPLEVQVRP